MLFKVRPYEKKRAQYALDNSVEALKELEAYVDYKYELSKVDSAAIPAKGGGELHNALLKSVIKFNVSLSDGKLGLGKKTFLKLTKNLQRTFR